MRATTAHLDEEHNDDARFRVFTRDVEDGREYHVYLCSVIDAPHHYIELFHIFKTATVNDVIYMYINTNGGDVATAVQLVNEMKYSNAHITTILEGNAHSAGSIIFLAGDDYQVGDHSLMMIHNISLGNYGKGNENLQNVTQEISRYNDLMGYIYPPFLTDAEIEQVKNDKDIWLKSADILRRCNDVLDFRETQQIEENKQELELQIVATKAILANYELELSSIVGDTDDILDRVSASRLAQEAEESIHDAEA